LAEATLRNQKRNCVDLKAHVDWKGFLQKSLWFNCPRHGGSQSHLGQIELGVTTRNASRGMQFGRLNLGESRARKMRICQAGEGLGLTPDQHLPGGGIENRQGLRPFEMRSPPTPGIQSASNSLSHNLSIHPFPTTGMTFPKTRVEPTSLHHSLSNLTSDQPDCTTRVSEC